MCSTLIRSANANLSPVVVNGAINSVCVTVSASADEPPPLLQVLFCRLSSEQRELYRAYLASKDVEAILAGDRNALAGIDVLRKICNHPDLLQVGSGSGFLFVMCHAVHEAQHRCLASLVHLLAAVLHQQAGLVANCAYSGCCSGRPGRTLTATARSSGRASCRSSSRWVSSRCCVLIWVALRPQPSEGVMQ